jgi:SNF2 family DNA or RNA helicase
MFPRANLSTAKPEDEDDVWAQDWMGGGTTRMPAAKIAGIKDRLQRWKKESPAAKIVIFSQFTDMIQIIADMCTKEKWENRCVCTPHWRILYAE